MRQTVEGNCCMAYGSQLTPPSTQPELQAVTNVLCGAPTELTGSNLHPGIIAPLKSRLESSTHLYLTVPVPVPFLSVHRKQSIILSYQGVSLGAEHVRVQVRGWPGQSRVPPTDTLWPPHVQTQSPRASIALTGELLRQANKLTIPLSPIGSLLSHRCNSGTYQR